MTIDRVAIFTPGDMGHAIARVLVSNGVRVTTNLTDRSERTQALAEAAGIQDTGDDVAAVDGADLLFAILPPSKAVELAQRLASALAMAKSKPIYVDLNAIAPATAVEVGEVIEGVGVPFVDGGIIGGPPKRGQGMGPRLYVSGHEDDVSRVVELRTAGLDMRPVPGGVGAASALKMSYAAITKGLTALATQSLASAKAYGVDKELDAEMVASMRMLRERFERSLPDMAPKAYRWIGEMEEIARTFSDVGLDPQMFMGAAETYRLVGGTALGQEVPERRTLGFTADEVAEIVASALEAGLPQGGE
jgi:3-hydroxyisobutyrate dehydrogenase-like beta-hydroxyacid dehydrogenase